MRSVHAIELSPSSSSSNNVVAYKSSKSSTTKQSASGLVFDYKWSATTQPTTTTNINVARVNAFYLVNTYHDILYKFGFTEEAFNFQNDNFGKGGNGNDAIEMYVQAPGSDNANFA